VNGLPASFAIERGEHAKSIENLSVSEPGDVLIEVLDASAGCCARANPLRIAARGAAPALLGDLHGQSEETIGTNSAREFDRVRARPAFLDVMSHQGNDFQITTPFWNQLNQLTREFNQDGRFIIYPGYEWSGNTGSAAIATSCSCTRAGRFTVPRMRWWTTCPMRPATPTARTTCSTR